MQGQRQVRASWILYRLSLQRQCSCGLPIWSHRLCTQRLSSQLVKTMNLLSKSSRGGGPVTGPPCLFWAIPVVQLLWLHVRKENVSTFFQLLFFSITGLQNSWAHTHTHERQLYPTQVNHAQSSESGHIDPVPAHWSPLWTYAHGLGNSPCLHSREHSKQQSKFRLFLIQTRTWTRF